jgi:hypothetical protein
LELVSKAIQDADRRQTAEAHDAAEQALWAFDEIQRAETAAEYGKEKNWYRGHWLTGIFRTRQIRQTFASFLRSVDSRAAAGFFETTGKPITTSCITKETVRST